MNVLVRYHAQLRRATGFAAELVTLEDGWTVQRLLRYLADRHPALRPLLFTEADRIQPTILIFVGSHQALHEDPLGDGAEVMLLTPIAGGA